MLIPLNRRSWVNLGYIIVFHVQIHTLHTDLQCFSLKELIEDHDHCHTDPGLSIPRTNIWY